MAQRTCAVSGCTREHVARGFCGTHYYRWRKTGAPGPAVIRPWSYEGAACAVEGCEKPIKARGWCGMHYARWSSTGSLDIAPPTPAPLCSFEGCGRPRAGKGLCSGHYQQLTNGRELTPLKKTQRSTVRDEQGRKRCAKCSGWHHESAFYPSPRMRDGLTSWCKRCDRDVRLKRNYGIGLSDYEDMFQKQGGACAICGVAQEEGVSLHIDHDHACCPEPKKSCGRCIRGLLCEDCNRVLGMFQDSPARFESAIVYLKQGGVPRE